MKQLFLGNGDVIIEAKNGVICFYNAATKYEIGKTEELETEDDEPFFTILGTNEALNVLKNQIEKAMGN